MQFGYPVGPQAVTVVAAEATGASLENAFDGLLLAIPVLAALAALSALRGASAGGAWSRRGARGLPYLAASFLAQSAFKETAMALFVLAFAIALGEPRPATGARGGGPTARRPWCASSSPLAGACVFVYSLPGLVWFAARAAALARARGARRPPPGRAGAARDGGRSPPLDRGRGA